MGGVLRTTAAVAKPSANGNADGGAYASPDTAAVAELNADDSAVAELNADGSADDIAAVAELLAVAGAHDHSRTVGDVCAVDGDPELRLRRLRPVHPEQHGLVVSMVYDRYIVRQLWRPLRRLFRVGRVRVRLVE